MTQDRKYKTICAWCNKTISEGNPENSKISHGLCADCFSNILSKSPKQLKVFIDQLNVPVIVLQESGRALYANKSTEHLLEKRSYDLEGELGGDIFECIHSKSPGGCGGTRHCKACTIKNSVEHTMLTGESLYDIPATLKIKPSGFRYNTNSLITTVRKKDKEGKAFVYLTIRDFEQKEE